MPTSRTFNRPSSSSLALVAILLSATAFGTPAGRLRDEKSAFLRSYADTLVDWMPWGDAAFQRAGQEQKPVFVAVGAFGNELSRAMAKQTFSHAATADMLNKTFVCVLVDRDEQPAVAALLVAYVRGIKQMDGWPLNVWLTPELKPYDGATYLPPSEEWGKPSFSKIAQQAKDMWTDKAACLAQATDAVNRLKASASAEVRPAVPAKIADDLAAASAAWMATFDAPHGGFGDPPRNLEPELDRFLLPRPAAEHDAAVATLRAIAQGAVRDPLDGGIFHSSTDDAWRVPYQQKLLVDQARLAMAFLDAANGADAAVFRDAARGALDYVLKRLALPDGTFAAIEDGTGDDRADYYAWTAADIDKALGSEATGYKQRHGVDPAGNVPADYDPTGHFKGKNLLRSSLPGDQTDAADSARLLAIRDQRSMLPRDERATAAAHGLLLATLARAGEQLGEPRYIAAATRLLDVMRKQFGASAAGDLRHLKGTDLPASPADLVALAFGCRALSRAAHRTDLEALAKQLLDTAEHRYFGLKEGRYFAVTEALPRGFFVRPFAATDPSTEATALAAGVEGTQAAAIKSALVSAVESGNPAAPGDVLLALATAK